MFQSSQNRLACKIDFSEEEEKPEIISLSSVDDAVRFDDRYEALQILGNMQGLKIGQGAHAVVKLAKKKQDNELYAVKIIRMNDEEIYNNVKRTFNNSRCLRHPNIVQEIELFINEKYCTACQVMEYCPYPSLEKILKERLLLEHETRTVMKYLLMAVMHCHSKGISHRDIKPDNILVNLEDDCDVKLIDFGVSRRFLIKNQQIDMLTKTGNTFYAAPEIYHNSSYSKEVDMWSVGVVMYQCLTGRLPLHRDNIGEFVSLLGKPEEWNFLSQIRDESLSAQNLISRLLDVNPRKRITAKDALNHPFIEKNQIYTTLATLTSNRLIEDDFDDNYAAKCKSLQTSLNVSAKSKWHRVFKTLHLGDEYQDIVIEDLIQELGNVHIVQRREGNNCQGFIQLMNSLGNSQGVTISKKFDSSSGGGHCNLGIGSSESIASSGGNPTTDYFGDLCNIQSSVELGQDMQKFAEDLQKKTHNQFLNQMGGRIECSIDVNVQDSIQENGKFNQIISTLDFMNIKECDEQIEDY